MSVQYPMLPEAVCKALEAIWQLEVELGAKARGATPEEIANKLGKKESYVKTLIHDINQISQRISKVSKMTIQYLVKIHDTDDQGPGRPHATYLLNHDSLVTESESAILLLEIQAFPKVKRYYVSRRDFVEHLATKFGFNPISINRRINLGVENRYIAEDSETDLLKPLHRIRCEKRWLDRVAKDHEPIVASANSRMKKTVGKKG